MPEGRLIPALFDRAEDEYLALGRPVEVGQGGRVTVRPEPPERGTSDLLVVLERPSAITRHEHADLTLTLRTGEEALAPNEVIRAATRVIAIWYSLSTRQATLEVKSARVFLPSTEISLRSGRVERVSAILRKRPDLAVELALPEGLHGKSTTLEVRTSGDDELVSAESFPEAPPHHRFTSLPPAELVVSLSVPPWRFLERVSLADAEDEQVYFAPEAIELEGTVFRGDEEVSAEIAFQINGTEEMLPVATDEDGNYEVVLFKPVSALSITLRERQGVSFLDYLIPPISASGRHDFHLPDNRFEVEVTDSESGQPIEGALVHVGNSAASGFGFNVSTQTDEEGVALLPPLREGSLSFSASAEGYAPTAEPVTEEIDQDDPGRRLALTLSPQGERGVIHLLLPSGLPAAGASACVKRTVDDDFQRWCGTGGEDGYVEVPRSALPGVILARHEAAGFLVAEIQQLPRELRLPERSGAPLGVDATDGFGKPVRWADVALFVDERKLTGTTLGWLTGSPAATNRDGFWRAPNVPAENVAVLVSRVDARERAKAGDLDHLRQDVPYPWRGTVEVFAER